MNINRYLLIAAFAMAMLARPAHAQEPNPPVELDSGGVVCEPGVYRKAPENCLVLGPARYLTDMAQLGLTFPPRPLPAAKADPGLAQLPFYYFRVKPDKEVPIYGGPCQKGAGSSVFPRGFVYISITDIESSCGIYYMLQDGSWIPGDGSRVSEIPSFQGLVFSATPRNSFAWAFEQIPVKIAPGYGTANTGQQIYPFQTIQIYATQSMDNTDWNMIGPDQWVEARKVAQVTPKPTPPEGVTGDRWIEVNLAEQTVAVYESNRLVFATMVATGQEPFWTKPGVFQIFKKVEAEKMRNNDPSDFYYLENVPWTMYYDGARALHGAYWRTRFGYPQSHGCVNLSVGDAHWLFNWAQEGEWVYVHDPSGLTPTDPSLYSDYAY